MKNTMRFILGFVAGAGVGATLSAIYFRKEYEKLNADFTEEVNSQLKTMQEEYDKSVAELKEIYEKAPKKADEKKVEPVIKEEKTEKTEPAKKTKEQKKEESIDYTQYSDNKKKGKGKKVVDERSKAIEEIQQSKTNSVGNYIIDFSDYTEDNGYEKRTCTLYADGIFTNDYDDPDPNIRDIVDGLATKENQEIYGYGESLYIRCDAEEADYELIFSDEIYMS